MIEEAQLRMNLPMKEQHHEDIGLTEDPQGGIPKLLRGPSTTINSNEPYVVRVMNPLTEY
jgi:hypothetical protein